jgi:tetratricopeptide (TPR) repeat protein
MGGGVGQSWILAVAGCVAVACEKAPVPLEDPQAAIGFCLELDSRTQAARTVDACTPVIEASRSQVSEADLVEALLSRGVAYRNLKKLALSRSDLDRAMTLAPKDAEVLRMLAWTYREREEYGLSDRLYTEALANNDEWQGRLSRCVVRGFGMERWDDALADCKQALAKDPNPDAYYFTAQAQNRLGKFEEAAATATEGLKKSNAEERLSDELVSALRSLGRAGEAEAAEKAAKARFPDPLAPPEGPQRGR